MSFRATPIALAREKLVLQTSRPGQKLPKYLKSRVVLAEATEREYQAKVDTARAAGQPVPKFKQPLKLAPDQLKWYSVSRSEKGNLPVYTDFRGDGGVLTMIRRIKGDAASCMKELNVHLYNIHIDPVSEAPRAILRPTSGNLIVKGNHKLILEDWLREKGF